jgi:hypothetical protein
LDFSLPLADIDLDRSGLTSSQPQINLAVNLSCNVRSHRRRGRRRFRLHIRLYQVSLLQDVKAGYEDQIIYTIMTTI